MSVLQKLTEGIVSRDLQKEGAALLSKWDKTGLLEGIGNDVKKQNMCVLLENQAKQLLREASTMGGADVEGFSAVAFPIVRRVFGSLIANDLVSVQPMSLPSGLIFFLDFQFTENRYTADADTAPPFAANQSLYGGGKVASQITGGLDMSPSDRTGAGGYRDLGTGYASPTGSVALTDGVGSSEAITAIADNSLGDKDMTSFNSPLGVTPVAISALSEAQKRTINFDPDLLAATSTDELMVAVAKLSTANMATADTKQMTAWNLTEDNGSELSAGTGDIRIVRRLTHLGYKDANNNIVAGSKAKHITFYLHGSTSSTNDLSSTCTVHFPRLDQFDNSKVGSIVGQGGDTWNLENTANIPEIDIKVDSIAVTAQTKKLKAKWSPELGQDLNAYHNLDAEVELTSILSEQIALEIDREILADLVNGATADTYYWSRSPGLFVKRDTGAELGATAAAPDFTGTVSEWYETLLETVNDVSAQIHRKTLRGGANFLVTSPEVASILEMTSGFRASIAVDSDKGMAGAVKTGQISKKWDVYVDPYFVRNVVLVGRKGSSFLESGYVYAPYVPLQVTPTIFGVEDFVPRKGVMTRYAKKMVRPDMYGLVIVRGLLGESGS